MKRIAIFCDGTWNRKDAKQPTNVVRLSIAVAGNDASGTEQQVLYHEGVGTGRGDNFVSRGIDRIGGGLFGYGLTRNIEESYRALAKVFDPGDKLYIFGFSRGAYTARSLAGLIRNCGIPARADIARIPEAIDWYRKRSDATAPDTDRSAEFRWNFAPAVTTGAAEVAWRERTGKAPGVPIEISYMGIWDTVGALGVPGFLGFVAKVTNAHYAFHDTALSRMVRAGRHVVAIDERRRTFEPTLWSNLDDLNASAPEQPYRQLWYPGVHGVVGGGGDDLGITNHTLIWIAQGAELAGLAIDGTMLDEFRKHADFQGTLTRPSRFGFLNVIARDRKGPKQLVHLSEVALDRLAFGGREGERYDPPPLRRLATEIAALPPRQHPTRVA